MKIYPKRIDLIKLLPAGALVAEIGVWRGYFSVEILNDTSVGKIFLVDAWKHPEGYNDPLDTTDHEANLRECKHHLRGHIPGGRVQIVRGFSLDVAKNDRTIPPLDGVFIDADHSFEACFADLVAWSKRLKPTGVIMGHDYTNNAQAREWKFGVIPAVTKFCEEYGWELVALTDEDFASFMLVRGPNWTGAEL